VVSWFEKLLRPRVKSKNGNRRQVPKGLWTRCERCNEVLYRPELERCLHVCPKCSYHMRIPARLRLQFFLDPDAEKEEVGAGLLAVDRLKFKDRKRYRDRLQQARRSTGETDALVALAGRLKGIPLVACAFDFHFLGGSMGSAVGERFVRAVRHALEREMPLVCFCASGGARMQEGLASLMQMAKTSVALARFRERSLPYLVVLTDPTMGGVSASLAWLGDVIVAEPDALIGFAGPRVIEQTIREPLPEGFQRSESLLEHGAVDMIVSRGQLRDRIASMLALMLGLPMPSEERAMALLEGVTP